MIGQLWFGIKQSLKHKSGSLCFPWLVVKSVIEVGQNDGSKDMLPTNIEEVVANKRACFSRRQTRIVLGKGADDHFYDFEWKSGHLEIQLV